MKVANGQLAGHNSLIIDPKITPSGLETIIDIESKSLDHSLRFISENNSCSLIHRNSAEVKKLISKIKGSFFYRCINSRYNKHLGFKDLFNEDTLMNLFEVFIKTVKSFNEESKSFNLNNQNATYSDLHDKINNNLAFISRTLKNKDLGLNSSDENELIHSAIKLEKFKSNNNGASELSNKQLDKICNHFKLKSKKDKTKLNLLCNLHYKKPSLDSDEGCVFKNIEDKEKNTEYTINKNQEVDLLESQAILFKKSLKVSDSKIFESRIWNKESNYLKLNELSKELKRSAQALNQKEKIIKENFIYFCKKNLKIKNSG